MASAARIAQALQDFDAAIERGRTAQAYLVVADVRGAGRDFAEQALLRLFCTGLVKPCAACPGCRQVRAHTHPDIAWVEPEMKSRIVGIERIRDLQRLVYQTSFLGGWKGCVLVSADRLGDNATNAFLKTLEEPPPRSVFFLLSDTPQALLPTLVSRCQRIVLETEAVTLEEPWRGQLLELLAAEFDGSWAARRLRTFRLLELFENMKKALAADEKAREPEPVEAERETVEARIEARFRERRALVLRSLLFWYRDVLLCVSGCPPAMYHYGEHADRLAVAARSGGRRRALQDVQVVEDMQRQLERNVPPEMTIAAGMGRLTA
jgi:DNA polymerase-3 subunit delta'